jgi:hypothetical protein
VAMTARSFTTGKPGPRPMLCQVDEQAARIGSAR